MPHASFFLVFRDAQHRPPLPFLLHRYRDYHRALSSFLTPTLFRLAICSLQFTPASTCGWPFHPHACTSSPLSPHPSSHPTAVQLQHVSLSLVWGAGLGRAAQSNCQLIIRSHTPDKHSSSLTGTEMGFTRAGVPFPHPTCVMESATSAA